MNEAMADAIAVGKEKLQGIRNVKTARELQELREFQAERKGKYAVWRKALESRLPAWVHEFMPTEPSGDVSESRCKIVIEFPDLGHMLFTGVKWHSGGGEISWEEINVRAEWEMWTPAGDEFLVALGRLSEMHEEELRRQEAIQLEAAEWERQGDVAEAQVAAVEAERPAPEVNPLPWIARVLERIADAVEDIAAVAVTLDGVLETAASNMSEVRVWGEEEGEK